MQSAQQAIAPTRTPGGYRERNPDEWDSLVKQGREAHREQLRRLNIPLTEWQTASDPKPNE